jgi:cytochrome c peroxidase
MRSWTTLSSALTIAAFLLATGRPEAAGLRKKLPRPVADSDFRDAGAVSEAKVALGRALFFDKELSGNRNVSCATCHHPMAHTGDGLSLPIGEGARGLGVTRNTGAGADAIMERVPRNAPPLFNLGAREFSRMFHDGRVAVGAAEPSGFATPAGGDLPPGLESVLAAQAMFPVTSPTEMAGQAGENAIADAATAGNLAGRGGVWEQLAQRLQAIPDYVERFTAAYEDMTSATDITYVRAANAIAAFEAAAWRADQSPFDRYLRGDTQAMSVAAKKGMKLFYGASKCSSCHAGKFQTDHEFYAIGMPQIGPGTGDGADGREDFGRERVTGERAERFAFRTPSLRNAELTGPWGHDGAFDSLEAVVRHHLDAATSLERYDRTQAVLPSRVDLDAQDFIVIDDPVRRTAIGAASELPAVTLTDRQVGYLLDFLRALTDPAMLDLRDDVPSEVPSGLPIFD